MAKSKASRITAICRTKKCNWRVYCSLEPRLNKWMVKVCHYNHNHGKSSRVSMLKQGVIGGLFREEIRRNVNLPAAAIKDIIKERYDIVVNISKCYKGRRIALDSVFEAQSIQFGKLWDYEKELRRFNKDVTTEILTVDINGRQQFNAVGRDADNKMYPIAWAVVTGENKDTWGWFLQKLKLDLNLGIGKNLTIISDKQKGLVIAVTAELPQAEHRMCARHMYANWKKSFNRSEYKNLFWGVAYSYHEGEYEKNMQMVHAYDPAAYEALLVTEPRRWCRAFFNPESHCADVHNNLSETFNRTIKMARTKPVITMLEDIRRQAMTRISLRWLKEFKLDSHLTPITLAILEKARKDKKYCKPLCSNKYLYEVTEFNIGYSVDLATHQYDNQDNPEKYVADYYQSSYLKNTYVDNIKLVNGEQLWTKTWKSPIGIPNIRKPRGSATTSTKDKEN
ncbi:PREDICTED: uncharacterized protein LOC104783503 [Camelina sativa]|uniref:Uncharacterized protein LOC104783503 n=1 Tax=Camelina sativa TaxID=90675 RepID=A0ABM0YWM0_CAMSA|nr:PREDICTED: uncharacterized protein LOC104783503 [Camelina sativa]